MFGIGKSDELAGTSHSNSKSEAGASFIGVGCTFVGNLNCQNSLRIEGVFKGNITSSGNIEIAETGQVEGEVIHADNIIVRGKIKSNIEAKGYLRIHKNGHVEGDIHVESLDVEAGAHFTGYSHTGHKQADKVLQIERPKKVAHE